MAAWSSTTHDRHCAQSGARWGTTTSSPRAQPVPGLRDVPPPPDGALLPTRPPRPLPTFRYPHEHAAASPALISAITTPRALPERPPDHDDRRPPPPKMRSFSSTAARPSSPHLGAPLLSDSVADTLSVLFLNLGGSSEVGGAREMLVPSPRARASSDRSETGVPRNGEKPTRQPRETTQRQRRGHPSDILRVRGNAHTRGNAPGQTAAELRGSEPRSAEGAGAVCRPSVFSVCRPGCRPPAPSVPISDPPPTAPCFAPVTDRSCSECPRAPN